MINKFVNSNIRQMKKKIVIASVSLMAIMFVGTVAGFLNFAPKSNNNNNNNQDNLTPETFLNKLLSPSMVNASALGNERANITIVEFADYQCPFCAQFNKETKDSIIENFIDTGKAKFLYKDYHDELFKNSNGENTGWITKDNLKQFANNVRVPDLMKFADCVDSGKYNEIVNENDSFARNIGLQSTPSFIFYNGTTPVAIQA